MVTGALTDDYRQRHPIVLTQAEHALDVPVAPGDSRMPKGMRQNIMGFAQDYKNHATGSVEILAPQSRYETAGMAATRRQVREALVAGGIPSSKIVNSVYPGEEGGPIRIRFVATTAVTNSCGQWPDDMNGRPFANQNYYNFGCSSQSNLAAQVANPMDLAAPRAETAPDAQQRSQVIQTYRSSASSSAGSSIGGGSGGF